MIGTFFYGAFIVVCFLFLAQLWLALFFNPKEDSSKRWKLSLLIFALSIMGAALFFASYMQAITPYTATLTGNDGSIYTQNIPATDAPLATALLQFANGLTMLNFVFMIVNALLGFQVFGNRRFNRGTKG